MSYTPYSRVNQSFSDRAHSLAQQAVYPELFGVCAEAIDYTVLQNDLERAKLLDVSIAVDRLLKVSVNHLRRPIEFTVQERFRKPDYRRFQDITITEWNCNTNQPSELYKIRANWFVYGYYDEHDHRFLEVVALSVPSVLRAIVANTLIYRPATNHRSNQAFITIRLDDLRRAGLIAWHYLPDAEPQAPF